MKPAAVCTLLLCVCASVASARPVHAQCPDGSPPPCGRPTAARAPAPNSIAVLYFDNLSRDTADAYLADGLTEEVIVRLQHVPRLDVKTRYDVRRFRGTRITDSRSAGRALGVAYLVTGSVRPSPSRMRVSYELVRTSDGRTLASDIVDTTAADPWAISNAVALAIAGQVAGRLAPEERAALTRTPSRDAQAVDLFRRGKFLLERAIVCCLSDSPAPYFDRLMSLAFFRAAITRDSTFADAWAGMADAWIWIGDIILPNRLAAEQSRAAARRALALDSTSSRASAALAYALMMVDYNWSGAERLLRRALELDPRGIEPRLWLAQLLTATGRIDEGWSEVERAWAGDSLNPRIGFFLFHSLRAARRTDDLSRWASRAPMMAPDLRFFGHLGARRADSALASAPASIHRVMALVASGRLAEARDSAAALAAATDAAREGGTTVFINFDDAAIAWAAVGDLDRAFAALEHSYAVRSGNDFPLLKVSPLFDNLRGDPRYHDLLRRMHLEP